MDLVQFHECRARRRPVPESSGAGLVDCACSGSPAQKYHSAMQPPPVRSPGLDPARLPIGKEDRYFK